MEKEAIRDRCQHMEAKAEVIMAEDNDAATVKGSYMVQVKVVGDTCLSGRYDRKAV